MSELMNMMRQLTQTRTAGVGQREEESDDNGRGATHNYSGGAGRVPPTADTSYGATAVGATAATEVPVHSRAASEPGRPADDTSRRPALPAGVSPKMPRANVSSEGKSPSASQDECGATTADPMSELLTIMLNKSEEVNMKFEELVNKLDGMVKEIRNNNQRRAGLQHQAQQPRLA